MENNYSKLKDIKLFLFDLEGVLIHNIDKSNFSDFERKLIEFNEFLHSNSLKSGVITGVSKDNIPKSILNSGFDYICAQRISKLNVANEIIENEGIELANVFYMGDDILDLPLLQSAGFSAAFNNARREIKRVVNHVFKSIDFINFVDDLSELIEKYKLKDD